MIALTFNVFQFIFQEVSDRDGILQGRPWLFDNQLLVLKSWLEDQSWKDDGFNISPFWIQVCHIPPQWFSVATGLRIGNMIGTARDVLLVKVGGKEDHYLKIQVELDLTKPLLRGTMLKFKNSKSWVDFKYETLPTFYFYYGHLGHTKKLCSKMKHDLTKQCLLKEQFGNWLQAYSRREEGVMHRGKGGRVDTGERGADQLENNKHEGKEKTGDVKGRQGDILLEGESVLGVRTGTELCLSEKVDELPNILQDKMTKEGTGNRVVQEVRDAKIIGEVFSDKTDFMVTDSTNT